MSAVFHALPGQPVPVGEIAARLAHLWADEAGHGRPAPRLDNAKASQINLVVHFGFGTTPEDALVQFRHAADFAARYPSRVVVLCPHDPAAPDHAMSAKIYGECRLGRTPGDARCCEFIILSYPVAARRYLEDQVSICIVPDLPLYYWAHAFTDCARVADYRFLIRKARRFILDSAAAPSGATDYPWPRCDHLRDLAQARLLPVRQSLGQFLARLPARQLAARLREIVVTHGTPLRAEAEALRRWVTGRLRACGAPAGIEHLAIPSYEDDLLSLELRYDSGSHFSWTARFGAGTASLSSNYGNSSNRLATPIHLLTPEAALTDALFF